MLSLKRDHSKDKVNMINTKQYNYENNLMSLYDQATDKEKMQGLTWYTKANRLVHNNSCKNVTPEDIAQIIAVLSPAVSWERNVQDALNLCNNYRKSQRAANQTVVSTYGINKKKALDILRGKFTLSENTGLKTFNFYQNILNPECDKYVTIDRHAFKAMINDDQGGRVTLNKGNYNLGIEVYSKIANNLGLIPCQLQAIIWLTYKRIVGR